MAIDILMSGQTQEQAAYLHRARRAASSMSLIVRGGRKQSGAGLTWPAPAVCRRWHTVPPRVTFGGRRFHPLAARGDTRSIATA
jgi:hypothetical protein